MEETQALFEELNPLKNAVYPIGPGGFNPRPHRKAFEF
jgi:hypothetical protein